MTAKIPYLQRLAACSLLLAVGLGAGGCASGGGVPRTGSPVPDGAVWLEPEVQAVDFLAGGESHRYALVVPPGSLVHLRTERGWRNDLSVEVTGSDGEPVLPASPLRHWPGYGRSFAVERGGRYEVAVRAAEPSLGHPGRYAITVAEIRPLETSDPDLLSAEAAFVATLGDSTGEVTPDSWTAVAELFRRAGSVHGVAAATLERGLLRIETEQWEEALRDVDEARSLFATAGDRFWEGFTALTMATELAALRDDPDADFARSVNLLSGGDPSVVGQAYFNWGSDGEGTRQQLRRRLQEALDRWQTTGDRCGQVAALLALGSLERPLGNLDLAEQYCDRSLKLLRTVTCPPLLENARMNRAVIARYRGEPQRALDELRPLETELEAAVQRQCPAGVGTSDLCKRLIQVLRGTHDNIGLLLSDLGQLEAALEKHEQALALQGRAWSRILKGWALHKLERLDEAETEFLVVLDQAPAESTARAYALHGLGRLAREQGRLEEARILLRDALALHDRKGTKAGIIGALQELGKLHLDAGDLGAAEGYIDEALVESEALQDPERHAPSLVLRARLRHRQGDLAHARESYAEALGLREEQRTTVSESDLRTSFVERWGAIYEEYVDLLMDLHTLAPTAGYDVQAFEVSERSRARSLVELLREAEIDFLARVDEDLAARYRAALGQVGALSMRLASRGREEEEQAAAELDRAELRRRRAELLSVQVEIAAAHPRYADLVVAPSSNLEDLQAGLAPGDALLEYIVGDRRSVLFVITRDDFAAVPLPVSAGDIAVLVAAALPRGEFEPGDARAAAELYRRLVAPAESRLATVRRLLVVPHRALLLLPFELLRPPGAARGADRYLLARWEVAYAPSATVLRSLAAPERLETAPGLGFVAFAPSFTAPRIAGAERGGETFAPLLHARQEVESIAHGVYGGDNRLYLAEEASESRVKNDPVVHRARRLHFATHGLTGARADLLGLVLPEPAGGGEPAANDGRLGLDEIFALDLDADLVVLSACDTARGEQTRVEGLVGFGRAFFAAGAPSVIGSLWQVDDGSTARLMEEFYRRLESGMPKSAALRAAKLHLMDSNYMEAHYWAPFILFGQPD